MSILIYITPQKPRRVQFLSRLKSSAPAAAQVSVAWGSSHLNNVIGRHWEIQKLMSVWASTSRQNESKAKYELLIYER